MSKLLKTLAACAWCFAAATTSIAQEQASLTADQVRAAAINSINAGEIGAAFNLAQLLLQRDNKDIVGLLVAARAAAAVGDSSAAAEFGRRAYWASSRSADSYTAARIVANALAAEQKDTRAQIWLRRARQYAPNEQASQSVAQDFQFLRRRNPWSSSFNFAITPSTNINNGTLTETIEFFGGLEFVLSADAQPLSGLQYSGNFTSRYRIFTDARSALFFDLDGFARTFSLSAESKEAAPDVKGSDYSYVSLGAGLSYNAILRDGWAPTRASIRFGEAWYAGDPFNSTVDLTFSQPVRISDRDQLTFTLSSQVREKDGDDQWVQTRRLRTSWDHQFENGDGLGLSFSITRAQSEDDEDDYDGRGVGLSYSFGQSFQGIAFSGALNFETKDYGANPYESKHRLDETLQLRVFARMTEVEFYGFQPVVTLDAKRGSSNVGFYDERNSFNFGFDLRSSF